MDKANHDKSKERLYNFPSNTYFYFKEIFTQEPLVAICLFVATGCGILFPFLNAKLPQLVLRGLEEAWELPLFLQRILFLAAMLAVIGIVRAGAECYMEPMSIPFQGIHNLRIIKKRLSVDYDVLENKQFHDEAYAACL